MTSQSVFILMVEDNPADAWLFREAMKTSRVANTIRVAEDGQIALDIFAALALRART